TLSRNWMSPFTMAAKRCCSSEVTEIIAPMSPGRSEASAAEVPKARKHQTDPDRLPRCSIKVAMGLRKGAAMMPPARQLTRLCPRDPRNEGAEGASFRPETLRQK